jgi:hypothetical protein
MCTASRVGVASVKDSILDMPFKGTNCARAPVSPASNALGTKMTACYLARETPVLNKRNANCEVGIHMITSFDNSYERNTHQSVTNAVTALREIRAEWPLIPSCRFPARRIVLHT